MSASHNALQRAYIRWAEPYYQRLPLEAQAEARRMDEFLYTTRGGLALWLGWLSAVAGSTAGLVLGVGMPWGLALVCSVGVWFGILIALASAWLMPDKFTGTRLWRGGLFAVLMAFAGAFTGFLVGRLTRKGNLALAFEDLGDKLTIAAKQATPILLIGVVALFALLWGVAQIRRSQAQHQLEQARVVQAQDTLARQMAEARLKLLQAQIQPHFIFNTLAALQHWVDTSDARAAPLLRSLTGFLRGSTELMARDEVALAEELALVRHYLAIMQARLGDRLQAEMSSTQEADGWHLPPGLLLTLVENALEHGVGPALQAVQVRVAAAVQDGHLTVTVQDTGPGLSPGWQEGVGLANARERLQHRFGGQARLRVEAADPGVRATLTVAAARSTQEVAHVG
ncbi:sensor histidine kinase [Ideonella sp.]|jgi:signal transduction histidine kinase|uniref:sensor histidine kinase n=1 Tax=Ideonella sp. TaxID=1929293 RepID=UPI0037C08B27